MDSTKAEYFGQNVFSSIDSNDNNSSDINGNLLSPWTSRQVFKISVIYELFLHFYIKLFITYVYKRNISGLLHKIL